MKTRALLTIIISLVTGFILGFIVSSQITRFRTRDVRIISSKETFKMRTFDIIEPSEKQKKQLEPLIMEYSERFDSMRRETHKSFQTLFDQYNESMSKYLSEDQIKTLNEFIKSLKHKKHRERPHSHNGKPRDKNKD